MFTLYFYGTVAIVSNFVEIMNLGSPQLINQMALMLALGNGTNNTFILVTFAITSRAHLPKWWSMLISVFPSAFSLSFLIKASVLLLNGSMNSFRVLEKQQQQHRKSKITFYIKKSLILVSLLFVCFVLFPCFVLFWFGLVIILFFSVFVCLFVFVSFCFCCSPEKWLHIGFVTPAIGPNKSKKSRTAYSASTQNIREKVWMKNNIHDFTDNNFLTVKPCMLFLIQILTRILCTSAIRRRSDYIIGFITPAIGPNKYEKLTWPIVPTHNLRGKVWMEVSTHGFTDN